MTQNEFDYKAYSLENLGKWIYDALVCADATPQEIYDVIHRTVSEEYYCSKDRLSRSYDLLTLLNGQKKKEVKSISFPDYSSDFFEEYYYPEEYKTSAQQKKYWSLPIEMDAPSGEYYVCFPDDLLEAANLKEGDIVEWIDQGDGSYRLSKTVLSKKLDGDGFSVTH